MGSQKPPGAAAEPSPPEIRPLEGREIPLLIELWKAAGLSHRPLGRDDPGRLRAELETRPRSFLGAFVRGELAGACIASWDGRRGWINRLAVDPRWRRTGVARRLVGAAEVELRAQGAMVIAVLVEPENAASLALFRELGYSDVPGAVYLSKRDSPDV